MYPNWYKHQKMNLHWLTQEKKLKQQTILFQLHASVGIYSQTHQSLDKSTVLSAQREV